MMKKIPAVFAAALLTACSNGPSESDMNAAVKKSIETSNRQMSAIGFGTAFASEVPQVKKIGCKDDGQNAHRCDIEVIGKAGKNVVSARFVKGSDGWMIMQ